jgi:hypothetical protein
MDSRRPPECSQNPPAAIRVSESVRESPRGLALALALALVWVLASAQVWALALALV